MANNKIIKIGCVFCICFLISQVIFISLILFNLNNPKENEIKYEIFAEDIYWDNNVEIAVPTEEMALAIGTIILKRNFEWLTEDDHLIDGYYYIFGVSDKINFWHIYAVIDDAGYRGSGVYVEIRKKDGKILSLFPPIF